MISPRVFATALIAVLLCSTSAFAAKTFYKWTDENGVTHYSEHKPRGDVNAREVSVYTGRSAPAAASTAEPEDTADSGTATTDNAETDPQAIKDPERCEIARKNLQIMENNARIRIKDDATGEYRFLNQQEKDQKMVEARQAIDESC